jgi:hypothetical protein
MRVGLRRAPILKAKPKYDHTEDPERNGYVEQRIIGTVIDVQPRDAYACFVEIECKAIDDATAFQIVSTDLPFEHVALHEAAGSRLKLICAPGLKVNPGDKVRIVVRPFERSELRRLGSENALGPAEQAADQKSKPVGIFAGPRDVIALRPSRGQQDETHPAGHAFCYWSLLPRQAQVLVHGQIDTFCAQIFAHVEAPSSFEEILIEFCHALKLRQMLIP